MTRRINIILFCGLFFILDRWLKWQALHGWASDQLVNRWLGWHPFLNPGVAFSLPVPSWLIVLLTVPVLGLLLFLVFKEQLTLNKEQASEVKRNWQLLIVNCSLLIIFSGALSNLIDRIVYGHTVDYFLILTAVINVADVMIVSGFVVYFIVSRKSIPPPPKAGRQGGSASG